MLNLRLLVILPNSVQVPQAEIRNVPQSCAKGQVYATEFRARLPLNLIRSGFSIRN